MESETCGRCGGTGFWQYDHNHSQPCPDCCPHDQGWWLLTEGYAGYRPGRETWCCKRGCGFTCDNPKEQADGH